MKGKTLSAGNGCRTHRSVLLEMSLFPNIFVPYIVAVFALYGEYVIRFPLPDGVFLPSDYGLDF